MKSPFRVATPLICLVLGLTLPECGRAFAHRAATASFDSHARKKAAILVFNGVQIIDSMGPYEVFGAAGFDVYTVGETKAPVTSSMGLTIVPSFSFSDAPRPDVLVVPGGGVRGARDSAATLAWVRDTTARAEHTLSVCNGAFILGSAGLLDGLTATTTAGLIGKLRTEFPKTKVVDDRRFVDNGKIVTAGGLSSGIDGALHVVATMLGNGTAQQVALGEEYDWRPDAGFARAALADRQIPDLDLETLGNWDIERTQGGADRWELVLSGTTDLPAKALMERLNQALATGGAWKIASATGPLESRWKFQGRDGRPWVGTLNVKEVSGQAHRFTARVSIERAG